MFSKARTVWISAILLGGALPVTADAGLCARKSGGPGRLGLIRPFNPCGCPPQPFLNPAPFGPLNTYGPIAPNPCDCGPAPIYSPAPVYSPSPTYTPSQPVLPTPNQPTLTPQTTTIYKQEQFTVMQPVTRTEIRRESSVVDVPVTTSRQVTVDEGSYQQVWVPKMTTKTVNETVMQRQVQYRDVPVQTVQQVPVVQTRVVPQQVTTMVPTQVVSSGAVCTQDHGVVGLSPHIHGQSVVSMGSPISEISPTPAQPQQAAQNPLPSASQQNSQEWSKVPTRSAAENKVELQAYEVTAPVEAPKLAPTPKFRGVPSAATVWKSQGAFPAK
ncbi:hypothetical protein SH668x_002105 [Planctomicrobium sp. SH668]|uniref:hypothetical protein n=1 Tax=Planctomicrobium sp. SH668 TaxID=3448126 RepID=UPI003F5B5D6B